MQKPNEFKLSRRNYLSPVSKHNQSTKKELVIKSRSSSL